jgi:hypothetical protein
MKELPVLGHIIDDLGVRLDPHKVDKIVNWKTPTSKELLMQFIGSAGYHFRVYTDHKGLEWISTQKKLSPRQARWLETLSEFDFEVIYLPGEENVLADALSRMYSNEPVGTVRAASEYVSAEEENAPSKLLLNLVSSPLYTGPPLFLGAMEARHSARIVAVHTATVPPVNEPMVPKPKKVILRVSKPPAQSLEGGLEEENLPDTESSLEQPKTGPLPSETSAVRPPETHTSPQLPEPRPDSNGICNSLSAISGNSQENMLASETSNVELPNLNALTQQTALLRSPNMDTQLPPPSIAETLLSESLPKLTNVITLGDPMLDIHQSIAGKFTSDSFLARILDNLTAFRNFEVSNDCVFLKDNERRILCIPNIKIGACHVHEIIISHAHSILAHLGPSKTMTYL